MKKIGNYLNEKKLSLTFLFKHGLVSWFLYYQDLKNADEEIYHI